MPRGGARPGAGRKKGNGGAGRPSKAALYASPIRVAEGKIRDRLPELVDVALALAIDDRDPKMVVYCMDRILGRPIDRQEQGEPGAFSQGFEIRLIRVNDDDSESRAS